MQELHKLERTFEVDARSEIKKALLEIMQTLAVLYDEDIAIDQSIFAKVQKYKSMTQSHAAMHVLTIIKSYGPISHRDILKKSNVFRALNPELQKSSLKWLLQNDYVDEEIVRHGGGGRPTVRYTARTKRRARAEDLA